jgi:hypothetical protein
MKTALSVTALALFALAPAVSSACEYSDASWASTAPPAQLAAAPAATKVPSAKTQKLIAGNSTKQVVRKAKTSTPNQKLAASTTN